jgi:hypothetical protein
VESVVPTDVVGNGVSKFEVLEASSGDLEVIIRVTPRPKAFTIVVGKDRRVVKVRGI